jgi:hypothetical protein
MDMTLTVLAVLAGNLAANWPHAIGLRKGTKVRIHAEGSETKGKFLAENPRKKVSQV